MEDLIGDVAIIWKKDGTLALPPVKVREVLITMIERPDGKSNMIVELNLGDEITELTPNAE